MKKYEGKEGNAATVLRPSGKVEVEGTVVDAVSEGDSFCKVLRYAWYGRKEIIWLLNN